MQIYGHFQVFFPINHGLFGLVSYKNHFKTHTQQQAFIENERNEVGTKTNICLRCFLFTKGGKVGISMNLLNPVRTNGETQAFPKNHWTLPKKGGGLSLYFAGFFVDLQTNRFWDSRILRVFCFREAAWVIHGTIIHRTPQFTGYLLVGGGFKYVLCIPIWGINIFQLGWNHHLGLGIFCTAMTRWWIEIFFYVHPYLGKIPILSKIFHMDWNHQIDSDLVHNFRPVDERNTAMMRWKKCHRHITK